LQHLPEPSWRLTAQDDDTLGGQKKLFASYVSVVPRVIKCRQIGLLDAPGEKMSKLGFLALAFVLCFATFLYAALYPTPAFAQEVSPVVGKREKAVIATYGF